MTSRARATAFFARSGAADAIAALSDDRDARIDIRLAVALAFLPSVPTRLYTAPGNPFMAPMPMTVLGTVNPPEAVERLLTNALDDREPRVGLTLTFDDATYVDPRVCDIAARALATRWPDRYRFAWSDDVTVRDQQVAAMRGASNAPAPQSVH